MVQIYAYGMNKDLVFKKEEIKCNNIIKRYNEESDEGYFLERYVQPEVVDEFTILNYMIYSFYQKEWKLKKSNLLQI